MRRVFWLTNFLAAFVAILGLTLAGSTLARNQKSTESSGTSVQKQKKSEQTEPNRAVVIGHLKSKDRIITVTKGPKGPLYTIKSKEGKILETKIDDKSLQAKYPDIYHQIKSGIAADDARIYH